MVSTPLRIEILLLLVLESPVSTSLVLRSLVTQGPRVIVVIDVIEVIGVNGVNRVNGGNCSKWSKLGQWTT